MPDAYTITKDERDAIGEALDLAYNDQEHWMRHRNREADLGPDWRSVAAGYAVTFRSIGDVGEKLGFHGEAERWESLAKAVLGEETEE